MAITRREFCRNTGALLLCFTSPAEILAATTEPIRLSPSINKNPLLSAWLRIQANGAVNVYPGKCELGQGIGTALAQIVADELDVTLERIRIEAVDTETSPDESYTFSSISIQHSGGALRQAATEMRHLLISNAARALNVDTKSLSVSDGRILTDGASSAASYWNLLADTDFQVEITGKVRPKSPDQYLYVGTSTPRIDLPGKIFAEDSFIQDVRLPDMLHARVVRPANQNQTLIDVDATAARSMPGVKAVVRNGGFLAVVASREEQAIAAADTLRSDARWDAPDMQPAEAELPQALRKMATQDFLVHQTAESGNSSMRVLSADYSRPFTAHAAIGPSAAIAQWNEGQLMVWSHGQGMYPLRGAIARTVDLPEDKVHLMHRQAAGCYGHNGADDAACDAAIIAMQLPGKPIRLQWSRHDEFRYEPFGSAMSVRLSAGLDKDNKVTNWQYDVWSGTHSGRPAGAQAAGNLRAAREKQKPIPQPPPRSIPQPAGGADRNALPLYAFPNQKISKHLLLATPLGVSALRGLGAYANIFSIESFVNELAAATGEHPLEFRLRYLQDARARAVLETLREPLMRKPEDPPEGWLVGRGLGFARFKNLGAYVGIVCEVRVNVDSGEVRVPLAVATVDAGLVISPDGLSHQIEGGIVQSTSWTLKETVHYGDTRTQSKDWATYPILRFTEVPRVSVTVLDRPDKPSLGAGEAAQGPTAAAIANAVTAASGIRLRDLPLTPERVIAALHEKESRSG